MYCSHYKKHSSIATHLLAAPEYSALMVNGHGLGKAAQRSEGCARTCAGVAPVRDLCVWGGLSSRIAHHVCLRLAALAFLKFALVRFQFTGSSRYRATVPLNSP